MSFYLQVGDYVECTRSILYTGRIEKVGDQIGVVNIETQEYNDEDRWHIRIIQTERRHLLKLGFSESIKDGARIWTLKNVVISNKVFVAGEQLVITGFRVVKDLQAWSKVKRSESEIDIDAFNDEFEDLNEFNAFIKHIRSEGIGIAEIIEPALIKKHDNSEFRQISDLASVHLPKIYSILKDKTGLWKRLQKRFERKIDTAEVGQDTENSIPLLLGKAELGEELAINFLKWLDDKIPSIKEKLPLNLHPSYDKMIGNMIQEFEKGEVQRLIPRYLNWLAEFLAIEKLIASSEYDIVRFESPIGIGNNTADYELVNQEGEKILVDVVSIHISNDKATSPELLKMEIDGKIEGKLKKKFNNSMNGCFLLPVLWYDDEISTKVLGYLEKASLEELNVISPSTILKYSDGTYDLTVVKEHD